MPTHISRVMCLSAWLVLIFTTVCYSPTHADPAKHTEPVGRVISALSGAEVLRDGNAFPLQDRDPIFVRDTIRTDPQGKAQIIFNDDTTVTIGCNATFTIREYTDNGAASSFRGNLGTGMLRIITGRLVEKNPLGFHIVTPEATVGIRGTTLTIDRAASVTAVYVENTKKQVYANDVMVPSGFKVDVFRGMASIPQPMTVADMDHITQGNRGVAGIQDTPAKGTGKIPQNTPPRAANPSTTPLRPEVGPPNPGTADNVILTGETS